MQIGGRLYYTSARILHFAVLGAKLFGGAGTLDAVGAEPVSMAAELAFSLRRDVAIHKLVSDDWVAVFALGTLGDFARSGASRVFAFAIRAADQVK